MVIRALLLVAVKGPVLLARLLKLLLVGLREVVESAKEAPSIELEDTSGDMDLRLTYRIL